jgi:glutathione S-transferase
MSEFTLYIGSKTTSSWSLRGWLACKLAGIDFTEIVVPLHLPETQSKIVKVSPSGRVPVLHHGSLQVWESIAIGEYLAELFPNRGLWPADRSARALARAVSAEMHAGFAELRRSMWMNVRRRFPGKGRTPGALADIARVCAIWRTARSQYGHGGPFLFGRMSIADAMYAPVATRFITWAPEIPDDAKAYAEAVWDHPLLREWVAGAETEPRPVPKYDVAPE